MSFVEELKTFALKGNMLDMAVGILVGTAFNRVVNSIVNDLFLPLIAVAATGAQLHTLEIPLKTTIEGKVLISVKYGAFLNTLLEFALIAFSGFVTVKWMNHLREMRVETLREQVKNLATTVDDLKNAKINELRREIDKMLD